MDPANTELSELTAGTPLVFGGNRVAYVSALLAEAFQPGDRLIVTPGEGVPLHIPRDQWRIASEAVTAASNAFTQMGTVDEESITHFYNSFAANLENDELVTRIHQANSADVEKARSKGRSTTRLVFDEKMRSEMVAGLRAWATTPGGRGEMIDRIQHDGWDVETYRAGLGVVGFIFEGRPNVFADATGVLRSGNTMVFRIGSDALQTARSIMKHALIPALENSHLPREAAVLVDSPSRASGWALFSDPRLALAIARGSGAAVTQLGEVARQAGTPVSLHGTGGAWIVAGQTADPAAFAMAVYNSLDRKVCNTLNTCCVVASRAEELVPIFLEALERAGDRRGATSKLHATTSAMGYIPLAWKQTVEIHRGHGAKSEPRTEQLSNAQLGHEWEWEESPEVTLTIVSEVEEAIQLFNSLSPRFIASLISSDAEEEQRFFDSIDSPFVGNGFTRWVDGQHALNRPELGLSNWQFGRLFGRGGILSGDSVYTIRTRATQTDPDLQR